MAVYCIEKHDLFADTPRAQLVTMIPVDGRQSPAEFSARFLALSPNGRYLACPTPDPGTVLIETESGTVLARYPETDDPSWSNEGDRLLVRSERQIKGMLLIDPARPDTPATIPGEVAWQPARQGLRDQWFWQLQWHKRPAREGGFEVTPVLVRYHPGGGVRIVNTLWPLRLPIESARQSVFLLNPPTDSSAVVLVRTPAGTGEIWRWQAESTAPLERLVEIPLPLAGRAPWWVGPQERLLWIGAFPGVPAWLDPFTASPVPALPREQTAPVLLIGTVETCSRLIAQSESLFPDPLSDLLQWPAPWHIAEVQDIRGMPAPFQTARRLSRATLRLIDTPVTVLIAEDMPAPLLRFELEARLWLSYLAGDYGTTLQTADIVEKFLEEQENREALVLVRLYALIGANRLHEARVTLDALARLPGEWKTSPEIDRALEEIGRVIEESSQSAVNPRR